MGCSPPGSFCPRDFSGKNIGVDCHFPPPGDLPNPGIKPVSPALWEDSLPLSHVENESDSAMCFFSFKFYHIVVKTHNVRSTH